MAPSEGLPLRGRCAAEKILCREDLSYLQPRLLLGAQLVDEGLEDSHPSQSILRMSTLRPRYRRQLPFSKLRPWKVSQPGSCSRGATVPSHSSTYPRAPRCSREERSLPIDERRAPPANGPRSEGARRAARARSRRRSRT